MTTTLANARILLGDLLGAMVAGTATSAGASNGTTIVDVSNSQPYALGDDYYNNWWVILTSGTYSGQIRRVSDYTFATGTITVSSAFGGQVASAVTYQLWRYWQPDLVRKALNWGAQESYPYLFKPTVDTSLSPDGNVYEFTIPSTIRTVDSAWVEVDESESTAPYRHLPIVDIRDSAGTRTILFAEQVLSSSTIRLVGKGYLSVATTDASTYEVDEPDIYLVLYKAAVYLCRRVPVGVPSTDREFWEAQEEKYNRYFEAEKGQHGTRTSAHSITAPLATRRQREIYLGGDRLS